MKKKLAIFGITMALALLAVPGIALAAGDAPAVAGSNPADGATVDVVDVGEIYVQFTNNVAESTVADGNIALIHLQKADGTAVAATVSVVDTQVDRDKRQFIYITPDAALTAGEYRIVIDAGVTAKNGTSATEGATISFTVTDATAAPASDGASGASNASGGFPTWAWIAIAAVVVIAVVAVVLLKKKPQAE